MHSINFTKVNTKFCLSLHCNGANSYLFVNGTEIYKFTAKGSMIVPNNSCLVGPTQGLGEHSLSAKKNAFDQFY